jgi:hypothetical protein
MTGHVSASPVDLGELRDRWAAEWPRALAVWSKFTRLRPPVLCLTASAAEHEGLTGSFAMIRLQDQAVIVCLPEVVKCGVERFAVEVLAHEIGHHVLAPATLTDHGRMLARMRWALPTVERHAPLVANLYTDLLINDRLQRSAGLPMADTYRVLGGRGEGGAVWAVYMGMYEFLWSLERGALGGAVDDRIRGDAWLGARLVRSFARNWLEGSGRFAALLLPHLLEDTKSAPLIEPWLDTRCAGVGGQPAGLSEEEFGERAGAIHPALDPELTGEAADGIEGPRPGESQAPREVDANAPARGQARQPFEYGEILRAAGVRLSDHEVAVSYYRERARAHLIPYPTRRVPESVDPLPEGLEPWDAGHPLDAVDWIQTIAQSPRVIPGVTTVQRVWGATEGSETQRRPLDLDLYVDSSGSMVNPQRLVSYPALAGAIVALSALRVGARVQATLWSGKHQFATTGGFVLDEGAVLRVLTGYFGGATAFPVHLLRDTYAGRSPRARPVHVLVVSDDGVTTMFDHDERGSSGWEIAATALARGGGGGTLVLNLPDGWQAAYPALVRARDGQGWRIHRVVSWESLVDFARTFSRDRYGEPAAARRAGRA